MVTEPEFRLRSFACPWLPVRDTFMGTPESCQPLPSLSAATCSLEGVHKPFCW